MVSKHPHCPFAAYPCAHCAAKGTDRGKSGGVPSAGVCSQTWCRHETSPRTGTKRYSFTSRFLRIQQKYGTRRDPFLECAGLSRNSPATFHCSSSCLRRFGYQALRRALPKPTGIPAPHPRQPARRVIFGDFFQAKT